MTKVLIYARFSPRPDAEQSESNETQIDYCMKRIGERGYELAAEPFQDRIESGDDEHRLGLWNAVAALRRGYVLLVYKLDRLARDVYLSETIFREVARKGARIESVVERTGDSPDDVCMRQIIASLNEREKKVTSARTSAAMLRHQQAGRMMGSIPPYGTRRGPDQTIRFADGREIIRRTLVDHPEEQATLARILELRRSGPHGNGRGLSFHAIAKLLNTEGVPSRDPELGWSRVTIRKICKRHRASQVERAASAAATT